MTMPAIDLIRVTHRLIEETHTLYGIDHHQEKDMQEMTHDVLEMKVDIGKSEVCSFH